MGPLQIDDKLHQRLKVLARERRVSLKALVTETLEGEVSQPARRKRQT